MRNPLFARGINIFTFMAENTIDSRTAVSQSPEERIQMLERQLEIYEDERGREERRIRLQIVQQVYQVNGTRADAAEETIKEADNLVRYILTGEKPVEKVCTHPGE